MWVNTPLQRTVMRDLLHSWCEHKRDNFPLIYGLHIMDEKYVMAKYIIIII